MTATNNFALHTDRLILRSWRDSDLEPFAALNFDHPELPAGHPLRRHVLYRLSRKSKQTTSLRRHFK